MRTIKSLRFLILLPALFFSINFASAQSASFRDKVEELVTVSRTREALEEGIVQQWVAMSVISKENGTKAAQEWLDNYWPTILNIYVEAYHKYFTEADLKSIIDFYKTPAGHKLAQNQAGIANETLQALMSDTNIVGALQSILMKYIK